MGSSKRRTFFELLSDLRSVAPPLLPVKVRRIKNLYYEGCKVDGLCYLKKSRNGNRYFLIKVDSMLPARSLEDTLIHEWAHCLSWGINALSLEDHGPEWGLAMSRIYQALYDL